MIKALFFDLDGTLLSTGCRMSEKTKTALKACMERGIKIFTATGRPPLLPEMLCLTDEEKEIIQDGGVFYNGGCICCNSEKIYTFLPEEAILRSIETIVPYKEVNLAVQMAGEKHSFRYGLAEEEYKLWGVKSDELVSFENTQFTDVVKIVIFSPWYSLPDLYNELKHTVGDRANVYFTGKGEYGCIDIVNKKTNKMLAADRVVGLCGLNRDDVAVFGDDYNDIEMLKGFKHSVAMGNACDEVKSCARYVTLSNEEEGIHYAINNILKLI